LFNPWLTVFLLNYFFKTTVRQYIKQSVLM